MKKLSAILLALALLAGLCACSSEPAEDVTFKNDLTTVIHSLYISPSSEDEWKDPLNYAKLSVGSSIHIDFEKFASEGSTYDVGAVDENNLNYDIYDVPLAIGDTLALSANGETAILTITAADGTVTTYEGYTYEGGAD